MPILSELRNRSSREQNELLSAIWDYYCEKDRWIPRRVLHQRFKPLGKQGVRTALEALGGSVVYEARDEGEEAYQLTLVGAFLTARGRELEDHLVRFLEHFRDRFDANPEIIELSGQDIQDALGLTAEQTNALFRLVWISHLCGDGSKGRDLQAWKFGLPYDIEDIPSEVRSYLEARLLKDFDPSVPFAVGERELHFLRRSRSYELLSQTADDKSEGGSIAYLPEGTLSSGGMTNLPGERLRRLRAYRKSLLALQDNLHRLASEKAGVVPFGQFRILATQVEEVDREFPGLIPKFVSEDFFAERVPSGDHYNISTMLSYLTSAVARIEELVGTRLTLEGLHPEIIAAAGALFSDGHYSAAIFEAFKAVEVRVRKQSGIDASGRDLMAKALGGDSPPISVASTSGRSGQDEQEGFKFIFMGTMQGIRNPKGHELIQQTEPEPTLEYLAFASLLMRRLDDAAAQAPRPQPA